MAKVLPYLKGDAKRFKHNDVHCGEGDVIAYADRLSDMPGNLIGTVVVDDAVIAVIGIRLVSPGIGDVWAIMSDMIHKHPKALVKCLRRELDAAIKAHGLRRITLVMKCSLAVGERWAESLGFQIEGRMRKFGADGSDYFLAARVR